MKRIVSTVLMASLLALPGVLAVGPALGGSVAYADHVTEQVLMDQLTKIKTMASDIEMKMKTKKMMEPMGMHKTMDMLMQITRTLDEIDKAK
ncbi:MAG: hypothetical protein HYY53_02600 [candidate division NC10 bacterium]|nr:hypothetical protein [candidate division NC10 bacterium]MBI4414036.1 hypothetical protein [candidate division NC10 bacterium]